MPFRSPYFRVLCRGPYFRVPFHSPYFDFRSWCLYQGRGPPWPWGVCLSNLRIPGLGGGLEIRVQGKGGGFFGFRVCGGSRKLLVIGTYIFCLYAPLFVLLSRCGVLVLP